MSLKFENMVPRRWIFSLVLWPSYFRTAVAMISASTYERVVFEKNTFFFCDLALQHSIAVLFGPQFVVFIGARLQRLQRR